MYEVVFLRAGTIPRTTSGKIQRHACRAAWQAGSLPALARSRGEEPASGLESWATAGTSFDRQALLGLPPEARLEAVSAALRHAVARCARLAPARIDLDRSLAAQGIDSLAVIELQERLELDFEITLPAADLFAERSLALIAADIANRAVVPSDQPVLPAAVDLRAAGAEPSLPPSRGQRALWFLAGLAPQSCAYHLTAAASLPPPLDIAALGRVWALLTQRHPQLRATFNTVAGEPWQRIGEGPGLSSVLEDATTWTEAQLAARIEEVAYRPFDLAQGPLLRVALFQRPGGEHAMVFVVHHIVADLWSLAVLSRELGALYDAELGEDSVTLPPLALSYSDYVQRQEELLGGERGERLWTYWRDRLAGAPLETSLLPDRTRPPVQAFRGAAHTLRLATGLSRRLSSLAQERGDTLFMVLLAAFQALLWRYTGSEDLVVGSPVAGRGAAGLGGVVGYFVNPLALRTDLSGNPTSEQLLSRVHATVLEALSHQELPFPVLAQRLQPERDLSRSPLFQAMFAWPRT
ncbi:MAG TPA: condensation domain-containing protein, partial [Thermoanaerobaculia bacterium]